MQHKPDCKNLVYKTLFLFLYLGRGQARSGNVEFMLLAVSLDLLGSPFARHLLQFLAPVDTGGVNQISEVIGGVGVNFDVEIFAVIASFRVRNLEHIGKESDVMRYHVFFPHIAAPDGYTVFVLDYLFACYFSRECREVKEL